MGTLQCPLTLRFVNTTLILKETKKKNIVRAHLCAFRLLSSLNPSIFDHVQRLNHSSELGCNIAEFVFGNHQ